MQRVFAFACALIGALLVFTLLSCDGTVPTAPDAALQHSGLDARAYPAMHSVTGQATTWYESSNQFFLISMNARTMPDGSAKGNFHWLYRSRDPGGRIFVKVSCLTIVGNEARMVGQASQAGNPDNIGKWMGLYVADNGEGQDASPDLIFQRWFGPFEDEAMDFCGGPQPEDPLPRELEMGNIQVR